MKKVIIKNSILIFAVSLLFASCKVDLKTEPEKHYYKTTEIPIIVRDFVSFLAKDPSLQPFGHSDFDNHITTKGFLSDRVLDTLDKDKKPVFNTMYRPSEMCIESPESFAQWFRTIDGVNKEIKTSIQVLSVNDDPYKYEYLNDGFFPIDNQGFGNDENTKHNYNFTVESTFYLLYEENVPITISCGSDDDLWLFVNGKLLIDLGCKHTYLTSEKTFDAKDFNSKSGDYVEVKLFKAERAKTGSRIGLSVSQDIYILK